MNAYGKARKPFLFILDFLLEKPLVIPLEDLDRSRIDYRIKTQNQHSQKAPLHFKKEPVEFDVYQKGFDQVMQAIRRGDTYLLNLTYETKLPGIDNLLKIFETANAPYKLFMKDAFVVFSPESFVEIADGMIRTYPMKGTIDASIPDAAQKLIDDIKEMEEHATVVDLLRNDLSIVSKKVKVDRYRFLSEIKTGGKTLLQCSSEISGHLEDGYHENLGSIFYSILPAGSVTGAPKRKTVEIISDVEPGPRDYYTGVFGVFDGNTVDSAVMIRMIVRRGEDYFYKSGGGITYRSDAQQEWQELVDKVYVPV